MQSRFFYVALLGLLVVFCLPLQLWGQARSSMVQQFEGVYYPLTTTTTPCTDVTLNAAITAMQALSPQRNILQLTPINGAGATCTWTLAANVTIPRGMMLRVPDGVNVSINTGVTLTLDGPLDAKEPNWHSGAGTVTLNYREATVDGLSSFVVSGCTPTVPAPASLTFGAFACRGNITSEAQWYHSNQGAATVGPLNAGNGTYWLALHRDTTTAVSGWTRQAGTHYLWRQSVSRPAEPAGGHLFTRATVSTGTITVSQPIMRTNPQRDYVNVRDPLFGCVGDGVADDSACWQMAIDVANSYSVRSTLVCPTGIYRIQTRLQVSFSGLHIMGMSSGNDAAGFGCILLAGTSGSDILRIGSVSPAAEVTSFQISNVDLDGNALLGRDGLVLVNLYDSQIGPNVRARNFSRQGIRIEDQIFGVKLDTVTVEANATGLYVNGGLNGRTIQKLQLVNVSSRLNTAAGLRLETVSMVNIFGGEYQFSPSNIEITNSTSVNIYGAQNEGGSIAGLNIFKPALGTGFGLIGGVISGNWFYGNASPVWSGRAVSIQGSQNVVFEGNVSEAHPLGAVVSSNAGVTGTLNSGNFWHSSNRFGDAIQFLSRDGMVISLPDNLNGSGELTVAQQTFLSPFTMSATYDQSTGTMPDRNLQKWLVHGAIAPASGATTVLNVRSRRGSYRVHATTTSGGAAYAWTTAIIQVRNVAPTTAVVTTFHSGDDGSGGLVVTAAVDNPTQTLSVQLTNANTVANTFVLTMEGISTASGAW